PIVVLPQSSARSLQLTGAKEALQLKIPADAEAVGPLPAVGVWQMLDANGKVDLKSRAIPVSLLDATESDLRSEMKKSVPPAYGVTTSLWAWPAMLAFVLLVGEWALFHRKITV